MTKAERQAKYRAKLWTEALEVYGDHCVDCDTTTDIQFDHPEGGGNKERAELFGAGVLSPGGWNYLVKLRAKGWPPGIVQPRCKTCHARKEK